ncbi:MAG: hypothetical protein JNM09_08525 [Blastocatellia bacterium]|nr:hypothetical protein [Blastocatellia bacterium]
METSCRGSIIVGSQWLLKGCREPTRKELFFSSSQYLVRGSQWFVRGVIVFEKTNIRITLLRLSPFQGLDVSITVPRVAANAFTLGYFLLTPSGFCSENHFLVLSFAVIRSWFMVL